MTQDIWEREIKGRIITGYRLVIGDDLAADPNGGAGFLSWLDGGQRAGLGSHMAQLDHHPGPNGDGAGAQCHFWLVAQGVIGMLGRGVKHFIASKAVMLFSNLFEDDNLHPQVFGNKQLISSPTPANAKRLWNAAFPWRQTLNGRRERKPGMMLVLPQQGIILRNFDYLRNMIDLTQMKLPETHRINTPVVLWYARPGIGAPCV